MLENEPQDDDGHLDPPKILFDAYTTFNSGPFHRAEPIFEPTPMFNMCPIRMPRGAPELKDEIWSVPAIKTPACSCLPASPIFVSI